MPRFVLPIVLLVLLLTLLIAMPIIRGGGDEQLVLYAGRSMGLVRPVIEQFEDETGINVRVRDGQTTALASRLAEAGRRSNADLFWAQDATALAELASRDLFTPLPEEMLDPVPPRYRSAAGYWVGTSGRARVLAYNPRRVQQHELPESVFDLTDPDYAGRVAWAPMNASFQAFVTAMRHQHGEDRTLQWLRGMADNQTRNEQNNSAVLDALAAGQADFGLVNHYYLLRRLADDPDYPVAQVSFADGDIGNLINVAGIAVMAESANQEAAHKFIAFLLEQQTQQYFVTETLEHPVIEDIALPETAESPARFRQAAPDADLDAMKDAQRTLELIREAGLL